MANIKKDMSVINYTISGGHLDLNNFKFQAGKSYGFTIPPAENPNEGLLSLEKEAEENYELLASSVSDTDKISKSEYLRDGPELLGPMKLILSDEDKSGIEGISNATEFSRTTVHTFYALSLQSGIVNDMKEFVNGMIGKPTQTYANLKNRINKDEAAKILSTFV